MLLRSDAQTKWYVEVRRFEHACKLLLLPSECCCSFAAAMLPDVLSMQHCLHDSAVTILDSKMTAV